MALVAKLATYPGDDDRREGRSRLWLQTPSDLAGAQATNVIIHDLSRGGLLVEAEAELTIGSEIAVEIPVAGTVVATVAWSSGSFFGCEFAAPISETALSAALAESRIVYPDFPLPTGRPPLDPPPRMKAPEPEALEVLPEKDAHRGTLSISARILSIIGISLLMWAALIWAAFSLF